MEYRFLDVRPISGALGAEIFGVDLSRPLADGVRLEVQRALLEHLVIFFRDQRVTPEQHKAFGSAFGTLNIHPYVQAMEGHPEIIQVIKEKGGDRHWGGEWHSDVTFMEQPAMGSILYAREVPPHGGDTLFANMYLAFDTLSAGLKTLLGRLRAVHNSGDPKSYSARYKGMREKPGTHQEAVHPVVRTHPETGRKLLFVNAAFTTRFDGMTEEESRPLLEFLFDHAARPEFTCRFRWQKDSVAFWDNRCTQHNVVSDHRSDFVHEDAGHRRVMHRVTVNGSRPV
jgi:taurine dioxygenase